MLQELGIGWADLGATGLLIITILMIFTGRLVPKRYFDLLAEDRDLWRTAATKLLEQNEKLLEKDDVSISTLRAIREKVDDDIARREAK